MKEKQVILSKIEFDEMEQELKALRETVESKRITVIFRRDCYDTENIYPGMYTCPVGSRVEFIMGVDENKVVEDLSNELKHLKKDNEDYKQRVFSLDRELWRLKDESNTWKNLPWHKRLFVK